MMTNITNSVARLVMFLVEKLVEVKQTLYVFEHQDEEGQWRFGIAKISENLQDNESIVALIFRVNIRGKEILFYSNGYYIVPMKPSKYYGFLTIKGNPFLMPHYETRCPICGRNNGNEIPDLFSFCYDHRGYSKLTDRLIYIAARVVGIPTIDISFPE